MGLSLQFACDSLDQVVPGFLGEDLEVGVTLRLDLVLDVRDGLEEHLALQVVIGAGLLDLDQRVEALAADLQSQLLTRQRDALEPLQHSLHYVLVLQVGVQDGQAGVADVVLQQGLQVERHLDQVEYQVLEEYQYRPPPLPGFRR